MTTTLNGIIEKITYKNNDNGFIVLKAKIQNKITTKN